MIDWITTKVDWGDQAVAGILICIFGGIALLIWLYNMSSFKKKKNNVIVLSVFIVLGMLATWSIHSGIQNPSIEHTIAAKDLKELDMTRYMIEGEDDNQIVTLYELPPAKSNVRLSR